MASQSKEIRQRFLSEIAEAIIEHRKQIAELEALRDSLTGASSQLKRKPASRRRSRSRKTQPAMSAEQTQEKVLSVLPTEPITVQALARNLGMSETTVRASLRQLESQGKAGTERAERAPGMMGQRPTLFFRLSESESGAERHNRAGSIEDALARL